MRMIALLALAVLALSGCVDRAGETAQSHASQNATAGNQNGGWDEAIAGMRRQDGFLPLYIDANKGKIFAAFPQADDQGVSLRAIYSAGLSAGLGSNPIGLDRGLFDEGAIVSFRRLGGKVIAEQENWAYRASAENPLEKKAVKQSFARSFIWSGEIEAEGPDGELLVDLSGFLLRDAIGVVTTLKNHSGGGAFAIADDRSMPDYDNILSFPKNVEVDVFLTLIGDEPKAEVRATAAEPRAVTLVQHHSLAQLPAEGYAPRIFDPRAGVIDVPFYDFSAPLAGEVRQVYARRFRLEKQDPQAQSSPAKEPIIFYVDSGAPEQIRQALIEGAAWWSDAFAAAGFPDSFRVEMLPEDAHPRDIRYNTISWTHRQTRGWSYGGGVYDPRTGEMLKASVILGSQRVRQDRMIFEGLAGAEKTGSGASDDPVEIALARIRQLSAHEVGHTLGFAHNFAASSNDRASVMDYPAPHIKVGADGALDFSDAYAAGIGEWDVASTKWLYAQFPPENDERASLDAILNEAYGRGLRYIGDGDGRSPGTAHPYASVWDNGEDAVSALQEALAVRRIALDNFGARSLKPGQPVSDLRKIIVPIYLYHRYQVNAAAKLIGGIDFQYSLNGDSLDPGTPVAPAEQRRALNALVGTLTPETLDIPERALALMSPSPSLFGQFSGRGEQFDGDSEPIFDGLAAAETAADLTLSALLHPARLARIIEQRRRDQNHLSLQELLFTAEGVLFQPAGAARRARIAERTQMRFVSKLIDLSTDENVSPTVRAELDGYLRALRLKVQAGDASNRMHREWMSARIDKHLARAAPPAAPALSAPETPPGSPIGAAALEPCWHCDSELSAGENL